MNTVGKSIQDKMNSALYIANALIQIPLTGVTSGLITGVTSGIMGAVATYNIPYGLAVGIGSGVKAGLAASVNSLISHIPPAKAVQDARVSLILRSIRRLVHTSLLGYKLEIGFVKTPKSNVLYIEAKDDGLHYQVRDTWDPRHYATCELLNPTESPIKKNTYYIDHLETIIYFLDNNKTLHQLPGFTQLVKYAKSHITYGEPLTIEQLDAITTITGHVIFHTGVISYESIQATKDSDFTNFLPQILHFTEQNKHTSPTIPLNSLIKAELADINPDETLQPFANLDGAQQVSEFKKFFNALYDFELCFRAFERGIAIDYLEMRKRAYDAGHILTNTIVNKLLPLQPFIEKVYEIMLSVLLASESINSSHTLIVAEKLTPIVAELSKQMNPDFLQPGRVSLIKSIPTLHNYFLQWTPIIDSCQDIPNNDTNSPAENILRMRENINRIINALNECRVDNQIQQFYQLITFVRNLKDAFINIKEILELSSKPLTDSSKELIFNLLGDLKYMNCLTLITSIDHLEQETLLEPGSLSVPVLQKVRSMYDSITNILQVIINFTGDTYNHDHLLKLEDSNFLTFRLDKIRDRQEEQEISKLQKLIDPPTYAFATTLSDKLEENILKTAKIYVFPYQAQETSVTPNEIIPKYKKSVKICMEYGQAIESCKYLLANIDTLQEKKFTHALHYSFIQKFIYEELPETEASAFDKLMVKLVSFDAKYDVTTLYFVDNNKQITLNNMYFYNVETHGLFYKDPEQSTLIQLSVSQPLKQKLEAYNKDKQLTSVPLSGQELHELINMHTKLYNTIIQPTEIQQKINLILQQIESEATKEIEILKQLKSQIPTLAPNHNFVSRNAKKYSLTKLQTKINQIQDWLEEHKKMLSPLIQHQLATANSQGEPFPNIEAANEEPQIKSFKILANTLYYAKESSILLKNIYEHTYFCKETYIFFGLINSYLHIVPLVKNIKLLKDDPYYNNVYTMFHDDIQKIHETTYEPYVKPYTRSQESVLSDRTPITNSGLWYLVNLLELINNHLTVKLKDIDLEKLQLHAKTNLIALDKVITQI